MMRMQNHHVKEVRRYWLASTLIYRSDWTASTGREGLTGCPTGFRAKSALPGSGIVPHVYSYLPRSQPRGRCTADIPGRPPQASSSSSFLYVLEMDRQGRETDTDFNVNVYNHVKG